MKNNRINILAKLGSLVGLGALAIAPIAMIGTLSETQVIDSNIATEVQDDAVSVTSVNGDNAVDESFELDNTSGTGTLFYTILTEDVEAKTGTVSVSKGSTLPTGALNIPNAITFANNTYTVTKIGDSAFEGCYGLTSVVIPDSVTSIGISTFFGCRKLTTVTIGSGVRSIGSQAFQGCTRLTNIVIPDSVTSIGSSAFTGCTELTSVTIGSGVKTIGSYVFNICSKLTSVTMLSAVPQTLGTDVFLNTHTDLKIYVPKGAVATYKAAPGWKDYANKIIAIPDVGVSFEISNSLGSGTLKYTIITNTTGSDHGTVSISQGSILPTGEVNIPNAVTYANNTYTVTSVGDEAFKGCSGLTGELAIPNSVTSIGTGAFEGCLGLTNVVISDSVTSIEEHTFKGCTGLTNVEISSVVTSIGDQAFYGCVGLTSVVIPDSIVSIGDSAFRSCFGMMNLKIGSGVKTIGDSAFFNCYNLTSVKIPTALTSIGDSAFRDCSRLTGELVISDRITSIGDYAFAGCSRLTSVKIMSITPPILGNDTFTGTNTKFRICVPNGTVDNYKAAEGWNTYKNIICLSPRVGVSFELLNESGEGNLEYTILTNTTASAPGTVSISQGSQAPAGILNIPKTVSYANNTYTVISIEEDAFFGCRELTSVNMEPGVQLIENRAFYNCTGLASVEIGSKVEAISDNAFSGCPLTSITLAEDNNTFSMADNVGTANVLLEGTDGILNTTCSNVVNSLACGELVIPTSVKIIRSGSFYACSGLTGDLVIPDTVTLIEDNAFNGCFGLSSVTIMSITPPTLGKKVFSGVNNNFKIYVSNSSVDLYKSAPGWTDYNTIIVDIPSTTNNNLGIIIGASVGGAVVLTAAIAGTIIGVKKHNKKVN